MIEFDGVCKRYADGKWALQNINFVLADGEMMFLTGHSGAGKSTFLKLIHAQEFANAGKVMVNDKNVGQLRKRHIPFLRREIGVIFQSPHLLNDCTVFDNVALPLVIAGYRHQEIARRVRAALGKVGLSAYANKFPEALSGGEQQRVGIARAVVNKPPLLIADEPTGNLDPDLSADIMQLFAEFNQVGVSVMIASHDLALISSMSYRVLELKAGRCA